MSANDYVELVHKKGRHRYLVRTSSGLEFFLSAGWRQVTISFNPDTVDMAIIDDDTYRIFSVTSEEQDAPQTLTPAGGLAEAARDDLDLPGRALGPLEE